jgi:hypothetical protein
MPLKNDVDARWEGWLIDGLGGQEESFQKALVVALEARNIPKSKVKTGTVNMWWRKDSRFIDVFSTLDVSIACTIHIQEYGTSLWVGRAAASFKQSNYYKRMAASAFIITIDRCIRETILSVVGAEAIHDVTDIGLEK